MASLTHAAKGGETSLRPQRHAIPQANYRSASDAARTRRERAGAYVYVYVPMCVCVCECVMRVFCVWKL